MLKVRLMGTKNDIKWFGKILQRNPKIEVTEFSDMFPNKGTKKHAETGVCGLSFRHAADRDKGGKSRRYQGAWEGGGAD